MRQKGPLIEGAANSMASQRITIDDQGNVVVVGDHVLCVPNQDALVSYFSSLRELLSSSLCADPYGLNHQSAEECATQVMEIVAKSRLGALPRKIVQELCRAVAHTGGARTDPREAYLVTTRKPHREVLQRKRVGV